MMKKRSNRWPLIPIWCARIAGAGWCCAGIANLLEGGLCVKAFGCLGIALANFTIATIAARMRKIGIARQASGSKGCKISGWAVVWWIVAAGYAVLAIVDLAIDACSGEIGLVAVMMQGVFASSMAFGVPICLAIIASESKFLAAERCERLAGDGDGTPSARL